MPRREREQLTQTAADAAAMRLAADAVEDLWRNDHELAPGDRTAQLTSLADRVVEWYDGPAASLGGEGTVPGPLTPDPVAYQRLGGKLRRERDDTDGVDNAIAVRIGWTADHLEAARRLTNSLVGPARQVTERGPLRRIDAAIPWRVCPPPNSGTMGLPRVHGGRRLRDNPLDRLRSGGSRCPSSHHSRRELCWPTSSSRGDWSPDHWPSGTPAGEAE